jgi:hypothetical protein
MSIYTEMTDRDLAIHKYLCLQALAPNQPHATKDAAQKVLAKINTEQQRRRQDRHERY